MNRRAFLRLVALGFGLVAAMLGRAVETDAPLTERLDRVVQAAVARQGFMGAVLVTRGGAPLLDRAYGSASLELEVPNTTATRFRIGSVTKQFTAAAILLLEERGQLTLADRVSRHVPEAPAAWAGVTLYQLLTHTSGLPDLTALPDFRAWVKQPHPPQETVERLRGLPLEFAPGAKQAYSNSNYLVLGLVIERVAGKNYAPFLHDNILGPLGLRDTDVDNNTDLVPRRAAGYTRFLGTFFNAPYADMTVPHAAGALYSTTHDLQRWIEGLLAGRLLQPATVERMLTPERNDYALGIQVSVDEHGRRKIGHGGGIAGFSAYLAHYPDDQTTIVVLANVMGAIAGPLARRLEAEVFAVAAAAP